MKLKKGASYPNRAGCYAWGGEVGHNWEAQDSKIYRQEKEETDCDAKSEVWITVAE